MVIIDIQLKTEVGLELHFLHLKKKRLTIDTCIQMLNWFWYSDNAIHELSRLSPAKVICFKPTAFPK